MLTPLLSPGPLLQGLPRKRHLAVQAGQLLLVLAHGSSAAQAFLGRRDTLQGLLEVMGQAPPALLAVLLQAIRRLSMEPLLLQALQASRRSARSGAAQADGTVPGPLCQVPLQPATCTRTCKQTRAVCCASICLSQRMLLPGWPPGEPLIGQL